MGSTNQGNRLEPALEHAKEEKKHLKQAYQDIRKRQMYELEKKRNDILRSNIAKAQQDEQRAI